jgi:hypothetical protein
MGHAPGVGVVRVLLFYFLQQQQLDQIFERACCPGKPSGTNQHQPRTTPRISESILLRNSPPRWMPMRQLAKLLKQLS